MPLIVWILVFSLIGGALGVLASATFLLLPDQRRTQALPSLVSFATGALLGAALLALLPHALMAPGVGDPHAVTFTVLLGLLVFFLLEKLVLWRHCHQAGCVAHGPDEAQTESAAGTMVLLGDSLHNFVDGVMIAAAFLTSIELGVVTTLAVAAHEIPQEVGDFAILLHSGFGRVRALGFNLLSSLTTLLGAMLAYFSLAQTTGAVPYILAVATASFLYVAVADLIPGLHRKVEPASTVRQLVLIGLGVGVIYFLHGAMH